MVVPEISPIIRLQVSALPQIGTTAGGAPIYGTTYATYDFDISNRLLSKVRYTMSKPRFVGDEMFDGLATSVSLELLNSDGYIATFANGGGIRAQDIEQGTVHIYADIGAATPIEMFAGRIIGKPTESKGRTILLASGSLWDAMRKPVLYEKLGNGQNAYTDGKEFFAGAVAVDVVGGHFCAYHGLVKWNSAGNPQPAFKQVSGTMTLNSIQLGTGAKPGKYRIEFLDSSNYQISYPGNEIYTGNIRSNTSGGGNVSIPAIYWVGTDGTGTVIEFEIGVAYKGNPVAIAYNLLEKGLLENWGSIPGLVPSVRIDTPTFQKLATRFKSFVVYVDAGNPDNAVWDHRGNTRPLDTADLAQQILKHVAVTLSLTSDGLITLVSPYIDDADVWPINTSSDILKPGVTIQGAKEAVNYLTINYAHDSRSGASSAAYNQDMRLDSTDEIVQAVTSMPFYKFPQSTVEVQWLAETLARRHFEGRKAQAVLSFSMPPQMGLPLIPGDLAHVHSLVPPVFSAVCEIVKVGMEIGGAVAIEAAPIQQIPEGAPAEVCSEIVGAVGLW